MIGLGMAAAVFTDALIVRTVLLPALMHTLAVPRCATRTCQEMARQMLKHSPDRTGMSSPAEANARLTASASAVLLALLGIEVSTVLIGVKSHLTLHVMAGLIVVSPLMVKIASVSWRFIRYYRHDAEYRRKGPPAPVLRIFGPFLLIVTLVLFVSGITLLLAPSAFGGPRGVMYKIHDLSFYACMLLILVHLAGHARELRRLASRDWVRRTRAAVPGALIRQSIVLAALAAGLALALSLVGHVGTFQNNAPHSAATGHHTTATVTQGKSPVARGAPTLRRGQRHDSHACPGPPARAASIPVTSAMTNLTLRSLWSSSRSG